MLYINQLIGQKVTSDPVVDRRLPFGLNLGTQAILDQFDQKNLNKEVVQKEYSLLFQRCTFIGEIQNEM